MKLDSSREIYQRALIDFKPKAIVMMFSGGDDSLCCYHVGKELGIEFDYVIHGYTGTGVEETHDFVIHEVNRNGDNYLEANAGDAFVKYVMRKGFFGRGIDAHTYAYHVLKIQHFRKVVSRNIRKRGRDFPILFINGARRQESVNRMKTMKSPYKRDPAQKNNIWVNIINEWTKEETLDYLRSNNIKRNPVSVELCRSGECMCGTMQTKGEYLETKAAFPRWGKKMDKIREEVLKKFPWDWGENINKYHHMELNGQMNIFSDFQPMCIGCKMNHTNIEL